MRPPPSLTRAEQLVADQVAGARMLDEDRAQADTARAALQAARAALQATRAALQATHAQRDGLAGRGGGPMAFLRLAAPISGLVRELRVAPRQFVPAGAGFLVPSGRASRSGPGRA